MHFYASQLGIDIESGFVTYYSEIESNFTTLIEPNIRGTSINKPFMKLKMTLKPIQDLIWQFFVVTWLFQFRTLSDKTENNTEQAASQPCMLLHTNIATTTAQK